MMQQTWTREILPEDWNKGVLNSIKRTDSSNHDQKMAKATIYTEKNFDCHSLISRLPHSKQFDSHDPENSTATVLFLDCDSLTNNITMLKLIFKSRRSNPEIYFYSMCPIFPHYFSSGKANEKLAEP
jgi:hypothetical protein